MANRIVGNVIIVDSAMGNTFILGNGNNPTLNVNSIAFWGSNSTGIVSFTGLSTADVICSISSVLNFPNTQSIDLHGTRLSDVKVLTLTAGTAWIYLA